MRVLAITDRIKGKFPENTVFDASQIDLWKIGVQNLVPQATWFNYEIWDCRNGVRKTILFQQQLRA